MQMPWVFILKMPVHLPDLRVMKGETSESI